MLTRFTTRRPELVPAAEERAAETHAHDVVPSIVPDPIPAASTKPLLREKLLDAKVRLHRKLLEEINLSALDKLPEEDLRRHVHELVSQYVLTDRLALNTEELERFISEIMDEMMGLGPLEPLLKD